MISRRRFLITTVAGISGLAALRLTFAKPEQVIVEVIRKRLGYLKLDEAGVQAFAKDAVARKAISVNRLKFFGATGLLHIPDSSNRLYPQALRHGEERIVTFYLLSSDFFQTGADETRTVNYLGFYDAFHGACLNSFARFEQDGEA